MNPTFLVFAGFAAAFGIGIIAFVVSGVRLLFWGESMKPDAQKRAGQMVLSTVERLGKFVTITFITVWSWGMIEAFGRSTPQPWLEYLRFGLLCFHVAIALYMFVRSIFAVAGEHAPSEFMQVFGDKNSQWEMLENRLLQAGLISAFFAAVIPIYFLLADQA